MKVLAVGAHPDDIEIMCGGTLATHADKGDEIFIVILSKGEKNGKGEIRANEARASAKVLGAKYIEVGNLEDGFIKDDREVVMMIEKLITEEQPDVIYCHHPNDIHQDHRAAARATMSASRNHNRILFAEGYESNLFTPTIFSDISKSWDRKVGLMKEHSTQEGHIKFDQVEAIARYRGSQIGVDYAEGFEPHRYLL